MNGRLRRPAATACGRLRQRLRPPFATLPLATLPLATLPPATLPSATLPFATLPACGGLRPPGAPRRRPAATGRRRSAAVKRAFDAFYASAVSFRNLGGWARGRTLAPPEGEMPKMKGPFWVVLVFEYSKGAVVRT